MRKLYFGLIAHLQISIRQSVSGQETQLGGKLHGLGLGQCFRRASTNSEGIPNVTAHKFDFTLEKNHFNVSRQSRGPGVAFHHEWEKHRNTCEYPFKGLHIILSRLLEMLCAMQMR